jgi:hypothetical protein
VGLAGKPILSRIRTTLLSKGDKNFSKKKTKGDKITKTRKNVQFFLGKTISKKVKPFHIWIRISFPLKNVFTGKPNCY